MTTARQVQALAQSLLKRNPDLNFIGGLIYVRPVSHIVRGLLVDRTSDPDLPSIKAFVDFSFNLSSIAWAWPIGKQGQNWSWADAGMPASFLEMAEETVLPQLRAVSTLDTFEQFASEPNFLTSPLYGHRDCQLRIDIALGRFDKALAECCELARLRGAGPHTGHFSKLWGRVIVPARPLLEAGDLEGLIRLLYDWQAQYVASHRLETIHEPTPFPIERYRHRP